MFIWHKATKAGKEDNDDEEGTARPSSSDKVTSEVSHNAPKM